ncbi:hypothetical protein WMY93_015489 [Mugilogobius chulae]|uniref:Nucleoside diphosphate kinase B n=1 Tax=Mugilogobius chulae TaxID=88201 RepID=A0AAW0NSX0_9GOBI
MAQIPKLYYPSNLLFGSSSMMPALNCARTLVWTAGLLPGPFLWRSGAPPSEEASHLLVSFRSPGPLLRLLSGPIRTLTGGSQPVKSHLSAVRTGLETPYTLLPFLQHTLYQPGLHFIPNEECLHATLCPCMGTAVASAEVDTAAAGSQLPCVGEGVELKGACGGRQSAARCDQKGVTTAAEATYSSHEVYQQTRSGVQKGLAKGDSMFISVHRLSRVLQLTLAVIKPDAVAHPLILENLHEKILENNFIIIRRKDIIWKKEHSEMFYAEHSGSGIHIIISNKYI